MFLAVTAYLKRFQLYFLCQVLLSDEKKPQVIQKIYAF